jgi:putative ABC transport system substrate-binding protein
VLLALGISVIGVSPVVAQSSLVRIGVLTPGLNFGPALEGLRQGLAQLGYEEGKQVTFIVEDTKMEVQDLVKPAMKLIEAKPDLLVTVSTSHTAAAKRSTSTIPIVFTVVGDPVRSGFIASYASSKNNLTGVSNSAAPLSGKRLELLKEVVPGMRRALVIVAAKDSVAEISFQFLEETAKKLGIQLIRRDVTTKEEIENTLLETPKGSVDAIVHVPSALVGNHIQLLIEKAKKDRLPLSVHEESLVKKGALVSYGADFRLLGVQSAKIVAKVLKGLRPSEIPIETPERLSLAINLATARAINLKVPRPVLERADRVVE